MLEDLAGPVQAGDDVLATVRNEHGHLDRRRRKRVREMGRELLDARHVRRRDDTRAREPSSHALERLGRKEIRLVQDQDLGDPAGADLLEDVPDGAHLRLHVAGGRVRDVHDQVGERHLLER